MNKPLAKTADGRIVPLRDHPDYKTPGAVIELVPEWGYVSGLDWSDIANGNPVFTGAPGMFLVRMEHPDEPSEELCILVECIRESAQDTLSAIHRKGWKLVRA